MTLKELTGTKLIEEFYKENPTEYLTDTVGTISNANYFGVIKEGNLIGATSYIKMTDNLALMQSTIVSKEHRGQGVGRFLNEKLELCLKKRGFGKITSNIYVENMPSIILKLKLGYLIEGTLRDHDFVGQHEYVLGKILR